MTIVAATKDHSRIKAVYHSAKEYMSAVESNTIPADCDFHITDADAKINDTVWVHESIFVPSLIL